MTVANVSNARSNSLSVIDTQTDQVIATIENVGFEPRGLLSAIIDIPGFGHILFLNTHLQVGSPTT